MATNSCELPAPGQGISEEVLWYLPAGHWQCWIGLGSKEFGAQVKALSCPSGENCIAMGRCLVCNNDQVGGTCQSNIHVNVLVTSLSVVLMLWLVGDHPAWLSESQIPSAEQQWHEVSPPHQLPHQSQSESLIPFVQVLSANSHQRETSFVRAQLHGIVTVLNLSYNYTSETRNHQSNSIV